MSDKKLYIVKDFKSRVIGFSNNKEDAFTLVDNVLKDDNPTTVSISLYEKLTSKLPLMNSFLVKFSDEIRDYLIAIQRQTQDKQMNIDSRHNHMVFKLEGINFMSGSTLKTFSLQELIQLLNDTLSIAETPFIIYDRARAIIF